jgi:hypothetical protein
MRGVVAVAMVILLRDFWALCCNINDYTNHSCHPVASRSEGRSLGSRTPDRGFESRLGHGFLPLCFYAVLFCVGSGLAKSCSLIQGVLPYVVKTDYEIELVEAWAHWSCRATDDDDDDDVIILV